MKKINIGIILFILFVFQSCSENNGFKIKGKVTGGTINKVILEKIEGQVVTYTKRAKLASLAGFDVEVKLSQYVPKDTNFSLYLNVARSKM
jgi:hypothetical protein